MPRGPTHASLRPSGGEVHYMLVTAGAVHIGHSTNWSQHRCEGILRVNLEEGLSNAERKSLRGLQDLDLELISFEDEEDEGYYSDESDDEPEDSLDEVSDEEVEEGVE